VEDEDARGRGTERLVGVGGTSEAAEDDADLVGERAGTFDCALLSPEEEEVLCDKAGGRPLAPFFDACPTVSDRPLTDADGGDTDTTGNVACLGERGSSKSSEVDWAVVGGADCGPENEIAVIDIGDGFSFRPRTVEGAVDDGDETSSLITGSAAFSTSPSFTTSF